MTAEEMPAHASSMQRPYAHHWRLPDEQRSTLRDFPATMARHV